ncbi:MAG: alanine racemase [Oscillospiraceae bacterium]|nr:alanine racemase [Oscillospiraceae bacterium]
MNDFFEVTRAEISLDALTNNIKVVKNHAGDKEIMAVVKANGYGHGIGIITSHLKKLGIKTYAVSTVGEAEQVREIAPNADVLILGQTHQSFAARIVAGNFIQAISSLEYARRLTERLRIFGGGTIRCHVKLDTGMSRTGIDSIDELREILSIQGLVTESIFTHFACADSADDYDMDFTINQQTKLVEYASLYNLPYHSQNSGGIFLHGDFGGSFVRPGISLYGYYPGDTEKINFEFGTSVLSIDDDSVTAKTAVYDKNPGEEQSDIASLLEEKEILRLRPILTFKSTIIQIRELAVGVPVSYNRTYIADSYRRIATIPVGYADGYSRMHSNKGKVWIKGQLAPIRGRVCMEYIMVDVTDIQGVEVGETVELYSAEHEEVGVKKIADALGTIPYEIMTMLNTRIPRVVF